MSSYDSVAAVRTEHLRHAEAELDKWTNTPADHAKGQATFDYKAAQVAYWTSQVQWIRGLLGMPIAP